MDALPTPHDVYERLATGLGPMLTDRGMQRVPRLSYPCWGRQFQNSNEQVYLSLQVDDKATDGFSGGGFRIEIEKAVGRRPATGLNGRALFFQLLTAEELTTVLEQQNRVIRALPRPTTTHVEVYSAGRVRQQYLSWFEPQSGFDAIRSWMRYRSVHDVESWVGTLRPFMSVMVDRGADYLRRDTRHLGRGSLVEVRA